MNDLVLATAINAKFIHSSLAIRYLSKYAMNAGKVEGINLNIETEEFTINHDIDFIIDEIYKRKPRVLTLSCYIWNIEMVKALVVTYKKLDPKCSIVLGGPEVSYDGIEIMNENKDVDFIISGEGEQTFYDFCKKISLVSDTIENRQKDIFAKVNGLTYRKDGKIIANPPRQAMSLDELPFPYEHNFEGLEHKILYYESTRGCPFNCQYCLSSIEKGVRYRSLEKVYKDLDKFLEAKVRQVKFVDRTFNCSRKHALSIWKYLSERDNGFTNFHFEIAAELLDDETIEFLNTVRSELFQFEIGVQSTNTETIEGIKRKMSFEGIKSIVNKIKKGNNIHQHLDLIAGLPKEDYKSFEKSFNDVYSLKPEQFQLGFLKVLKGSGLYRDQKALGLIYRDYAPYEILYTPSINYDEMLKLKAIEEMVESYYNSGRYSKTISYAQQLFKSPFDFYESLGTYWEAKGHHTRPHNKIEMYTILYEFLCETVEDRDLDKEILQWLLKFDLYSHEKARKLPTWLEVDLSSQYQDTIKSFYWDEERANTFLPELKEFDGKQKSRKVHMEVFPFDITTEEYRVERPTAILFNYFDKDLLGNARRHKIRL